MLNFVKVAENDFQKLLEFCFENKLDIYINRNLYFEEIVTETHGYISYSSSKIGYRNVSIECSHEVMILMRLMFNIRDIL